MIDHGGSKFSLFKLLAAATSGLSVMCAGAFGYLLVEGQPVILAAVTVSALVLLDLAKISSLVQLSRRCVGKIVGLFVVSFALLLAAISFAGSFAVYQHFVGAQEARAALVRAKREELLSKRDRFERDLEALGEVRPLVVAEIELRDFRAMKSYRARSGECTKQVAGTLELCRQDIELSGIVEVAKQAEELTKKISDLDDKIAEATTAKALDTGKRGLVALAGLLGYGNEFDIEAIKGLVFATAIELASLVLMLVAGAPMKEGVALGQGRIGGGTQVSDTAGASPEASLVASTEAPAGAFGAELIEPPPEAQPEPPGKPPSGGRKASVPPAKTGRSRPPLRLVQASGEASVGPRAKSSGGTSGGGSVAGLNAFLETLPIEPGKAYYLDELKAPYVALAETSGWVAEKWNNKLSPALIAAGFTKRKDSSGRMVFIDHRSGMAVSA